MDALASSIFQLQCFYSVLDFAVSLQNIVDICYKRSETKRYMTGCMQLIHCWLDKFGKLANNSRAGGTFYL